MSEKMSIPGRADFGEECGHCHKSPTIEGHDACIGTLENIMNACCGHGGKIEPYVQFWSHSDAKSVCFVEECDIDEVNCIRGEKAKKYIHQNKAPEFLP